MQEKGVAWAGRGICVVVAVAGFVGGFMSPTTTIGTVAAAVVIGATLVNVLTD